MNEQNTLGDTIGIIKETTNVRPLKNYNLLSGNTCSDHNNMHNFMHTFCNNQLSKIQLGVNSRLLVKVNLSLEAFLAFSFD